MPTPLPQISSRAWEHPADRAALNTLRAIPGFDEVVRQVATFVTERRVRQLFLANAVQVNPVQRPKLDALLTDVCRAMDWPTRPELYVTQSPEVNAYAIGYRTRSSSSRRVHSSCWRATMSAASFSRTSSGTS